MKEQIIEKVKSLLDDGRIKGFLGLREKDGHIGPYLFTDSGELADLSLGERDKPGEFRYPLPQIAGTLLEKFPQEKLGILVRGCDERALMELKNESRVTPIHAENLVLIGFPCPAELAREHQCAKPWPDALVVGEAAVGVENPAGEKEDEDLFGQLEYWYETFNRCVKCFGCRNVCPVCSCKECTVEEEVFVPQRELPPAPFFLMTRALHMVDRCVYCGLCEEACPADIPLKSLYRFVARTVGQQQSLPGVRPVMPHLQHSWPIFLSASPAE